MTCVLEGGSCTDSGRFRGVEDLCRGRTLAPLSQSLLDSMETYGFFEAVRDCIFDAPKVYLALRGLVEADWNSDGNFGWLLYNADDALLPILRLEKSQGVTVL